MSEREYCGSCGMPDSQCCGVGKPKLVRENMALRERVAELEAKDIEADWLDMSRCIQEQRSRIAKLEAVVEAQAKVLVEAEGMRWNGVVTAFGGVNPYAERYDAAKAELERVR